MASLPLDELKVFLLAERLADEAWDVVSVWTILARDTIGKQLIRAADSIGANIAEGYGRGSYQDNRRFIRIARGSMHETRFWLRRAHRRALIPPERSKILQDLMSELAPMLNGYLKSIGRRSTD